MMRLSRKLVPVLMAAITFAAEPVNAIPAPVLISFDVETDDDAETIPLLPVVENATYFVVGAFAERHPGLVAELARRNTIGSHSYSHQHLRDMDENSLRMDLRLSRMVIEQATGKPVEWFRAPYMEYDQRVSATASDLGFRYGSSDYERWQRNTHLMEIPISHGLGEIPVDDHELFVRREMTDDEVLDWLIGSYDRRSTTGRPFVMLLHPRIMVDHVDLLAEFITHVRQQDGVLLSYDEYNRRIHSRSPQRLGVWVNFNLGDHDPGQIAQDLSGTGITDVFLMARSPEGVDYYREEGESSSGSLFGRTLSLLKEEDIRVHAWIPVFLNRRLATERPEWAMIGARGVPSPDWISPANPDVRDYFIQTVLEIVDGFPVDGIHLDYIRFPGLDYDFSTRALQSFVQDTGIEPSGEDLATWILSEAYVEWTDWRADLLGGFVEQIAGITKERGLTLSAALLAQSATSYRVMETSGQDFRELSEHLDLVIPMAYHHTEQQPVDWIERVLYATRLEIGETPLFVGLSAYQSPGDWSYPLDEFEEALRFARRGSEGIVVYPYLYLFGRGDARFNMPPGSAQAFLRAVDSSLAGLPLGIIAAGMVVSIVIGLAWWKRRSSGNRSRLTVDAPTVLVEWRELDREIQQGNFAGTLAEQVSVWLRRFASAKVSRYRIMFLLDTAVRVNGRKDELEQVLGEIPGWSLLGRQYLEEACLAGHLWKNNGVMEVTAQGMKELVQARQEGYSKELWEFIEHRLHETLKVPCPHCGFQNAAYWFWFRFDCTSCRGQVDLRDCRGITIQPPQVPLTGYVISS